VPKLVLCGHVHNYQRFETEFLDEPCTFVVAGMGGHAKDKLKGPHDPDTRIDHEYPVTLKLATDKFVGFLPVRVAGGRFHCDYLAVGEDGPIDSFVV
jgi:acid phosphatase type 7